LIQNCVEFFCFGVILSYITQIWKFKSQSSLEKLEESKYTKKKSLLIAKKKKKLKKTKKKKKKQTPPPPPPSNLFFFFLIDDIFCKYNNTLELIYLIP